MTHILRRPRRNRKSGAIREMVQETRLSISDLIYPMFVVDGTGIRTEVSSMPGIYRHSIDLLLEELKELQDLGIKAIDLFPNYPEEKRIAWPLKAIRKTLSTYVP